MMQRLGRSAIAVLVGRSPLARKGAIAVEGKCDRAKTAECDRALLELECDRVICSHITLAVSVEQCDGKECDRQAYTASLIQAKLPILHLGTNTPLFCQIPTPSEKSQQYGSPHLFNEAISIFDHFHLFLT